MAFSLCGCTLKGTPTKGTTRPENADVEEVKKKNPLNNQRVLSSFGAEGEI